MPRANRQGFTLVELLVGVGIMAILVTIALPSFSAWLQNVQIRNAAESVLNGLQLARAHAIRSNMSTQFIFTAADPVAANVLTAVPSTSGKNWVVRTIQPDATTYGAPIVGGFIQGRSGQEGSKNATITSATPAFTFTPLGRLIDPLTLNPPSACVKVVADNTSSYTGKRNMQIIISSGGQILMCDPNKVDPLNPQFCPAATASCP